MADRTLTVKVIGDDRDLQRMFDRQGRQAKGLEGQFVGLSRSLKVGLGAAGVAVGLTEAFSVMKQSVGAAVDLNEEISKSQQIFGDHSKELEDWSKTTARSLGISRVAALQATGTFGNLFVAIGTAPDDAAKMSRALVELAADLASFNNADPSEVLAAIRSGLVGEAEPLKRYGVLLSEARVQQVALEASGKRNVAALTNQEKAQARYSIILADTVKAQGDVERTSGSLANQQRILAAQITDLETSLGAVLIPTLTDLVSTLNTAATAAQGLVGFLEQLKNLGPIEIPVQMPVSIIFQARTPGGVEGIVKDLGDKIRDGISSATSAGIAPLENLIRQAQTGSGLGFTFFPAPVDTRGGADAGEGVKDAVADSKKSLDQAAQAVKDLQRSRREFQALTKGLGLKLDKAGLTAALNDDIAALEELERAILRQIRREGKTFELVDQLTSTRLQLSSLRAQQAEAAAQTSRDAYERIIGALNLQLDRALRTQSLQDDLDALRNIEAAIKKRIAAEGRTIQLLEDLDRVRAQVADKEREVRERQKEQRQARQFEALGLTPEGGERTESGQTLRRRASTLEDQIKGTVLDTKQTRRELDRIQSVLSGDLRKVGKNVREAIQRMLDEIAGALEGDQKSGQKTKFAKRGIDQLIEGLGLSPEQVKELRQRFAGAPGQVGPPSVAGAPERRGKLPSTAGGGEQPTIFLDVTLEIDGKELSTRVTRQQQKKRGQGSPSRRGPNAGRR